MPLRPCTRLGPFEITAQIGEGGMGEVYRARDLRLKRDVALKVLPDRFAFDSERLTRFEREAQILASRGLMVDKRTDIWSFGCVLYEMLTGCRAFAGETVSDTIATILAATPAWHRLPNGVPGPVQRLLRWCLEKDLQRRLRDIGDARVQLEYAMGGPFEDGPSQPPVTARQVEFQRLSDFAGMKGSPAVSPDGKMVAFVALLGGRRQILVRLLGGGAPLQVTRDDLDHEQPRWSPDSSTLIYYMPSGRPGEGTISEIAALGGPSRRIGSAMGGGDLSHDGRQVAFFQSFSESVELLVVARNGSRRERVAILPPGYTYTSPRWSPDDRFIAFQHQSVVGRFDLGLDIVQVESGERREVTRSEWLRGFSWLPEGSGLLYSSSRGSTVVYPPVFNLRKITCDGRRDEQVTFGDMSYVEPDVHNSGKVIVTRVRDQSDVWKFPVDGTAADNTRSAVRITRQTGKVQTPSVSPDGSEVVYLSDNGGHGNLWVLRSDGSGLRQLTFERDPEAALGLPMWAPSGEWIVFVVTHAGRTGLSAIRPDGSDLHELASRGWGPSWSGDGRWVYYTSERNGGMCLEKIPAEGGQPIKVRSHTAHATITPDETTVYYIHPDRSGSFGVFGDLEICRVGVDDGAPTVIARIGSGRVPLSPHMFTLSVSPDGRWLAAPLTDGATANVWALPVFGGPMQPLTDFGDRSVLITRNVSWSADGRHFYAAVAEIENDIVAFDGLLQ